MMHVMVLAYRFWIIAVFALALAVGWVIVEGILRRE